MCVVAVEVNDSEIVILCSRTSTAYYNRGEILSSSLSLTYRGKAAAIHDETGGPGSRKRRGHVVKEWLFF